MNLPHDFIAGIDPATNEVLILSPMNDEQERFVCRIPIHLWKLIANVEIPASPLIIEIVAAPVAASEPDLREVYNFPDTGGAFVAEDGPAVPA